jgi:beta-glucosidase
VEWPAKELKAFQRVSLKAGELKKITLNVPMKELRYWNEESNAWELEHGKLEVLVGSASDDIRLNTDVTI